jgi:hypothetical protein
MRVPLRPALLFATALAVVPASPQHASASLGAGGPPAAGAWIWTRADVRLLQSARAPDPTLRAAVHVATIERRFDGSYISHIALSPDVVDGPGHEVAAVIRFDGSLDAAWDADSEAAVADGLSPVLSRILEQVDGTGVRATEVQLDHDAPVRALARWGRVVGILTSGPLRGRDVWITSLPAHVEVAGYGEIFGRIGVGHILQVFDTGLACTPEHASRLAAKLRAAGLRFRVGVGGFEREARPGEHECWRTEAASWRALPGYAGVWVFPAGRDILRSLAPFEAP